jgi:RNA polymerase sigma-70 factor (ECF subfamily)
VNALSRTLDGGWDVGNVAVMQESEEGRLVREACAGDPSAFEQIYRRHAARVYALCLRLTADPAGSEDLAQETFVRAWQKLSMFEGRSRLSTWLHRLAVNVVLNHRRRRGSMVWEPLEEEPPAKAAGGGRTPEGATADLEKAIAELPEAARTVFVLHDVYGYQHDDIAGMAGIASGTSRAHLHRARRLLREALGS